jgi:cytochrome P450
MSEPDILSKPLNQTSPMNPEALACPHEFNARLRAEAPVYRCPHTGIVFVSDYDTVTAIARDHGTFSSKFGLAMRSEGDADPRLAEVQKEGYPTVDTMLTQDPPVHRRYRAWSIRLLRCAGFPPWMFTSRRSATA